MLNLLIADTPELGNGGRVASDHVKEARDSGYSPFHKIGNGFSLYSNNNWHVEGKKSDNRRFIDVLLNDDFYGFGYSWISS